jgi:glutathione S-transferase
MRALDISTSWMASVATLGRGMRQVPLGPRPTGQLTLYELESCPFCRRAREAVSLLDLEVLIKPCPKGGMRFRPELQTRGGRAQLPYLVDEGAGVELYESNDIVAHLFDRYGAGDAPWGVTSRLTFAGSASVGLFRAGMGRRAMPSHTPEQPLVLYGFDVSPYTRLVREALCELELPYFLRPTPKGSDRWAELEDRGGKRQVPYLVDPNHGVEMYESAAIKRYLWETWAA